MKTYLKGFIESEDIVIEESEDGITIYILGESDAGTMIPTEELVAVKDLLFDICDKRGLE